MSFEQEYGSLSYTDNLPDYYGLPLEQINNGNSALHLFLNSFSLSIFITIF